MQAFSHHILLNYSHAELRQLKAIAMLQVEAVEEHKFKIKQVKTGIVKNNPKKAPGLDQVTFTPICQSIILINYVPITMGPGKAD